jgi:hypothetical protein
MFIGAIGAGLFIYGKKAERLKCILIGVLMCVYPYFVSSLLLMWAIAGLCLAGAYFLPLGE